MSPEEVDQIIGQAVGVLSPFVVFHHRGTRSYSKLQKQAQLSISFKRAFKISDHAINPLWLHSRTASCGCNSFCKQTLLSQKLISPSDIKTARINYQQKKEHTKLQFVLDYCRTHQDQKGTIHWRIMDKLVCQKT